MRLLAAALPLLLSCTAPPVQAPLPEDQMRAVVALVDDEGKAYCSGTLIREGVLTAYHCVAGSEEVSVGLFEDFDRVELYWRVTYTVGVLQANRDYDLALLDWRPATSPFLAMAPRSPRVGSEVVAMGHPLGIPYVALHGHVSRFPHFRTERPRAWFLVDNDLVEGMSGGPVLDTQGRLCGVISHYFGVRQLGAVVPAETVSAFLEERL